jgi:hypothetical protein
VFKNPSSHRQVEYDDPTLAAEVVLLADLLLRILDRTERRLKTANEFDVKSVRRSAPAKKAPSARRRRSPSVAESAKKQ